LAGLVVAMRLGWRNWQRARALRLELSAHPLRPGETCAVSATHPDPEILRRLRLSLVGEESADALSGGGRGGGSSKTTSRRVFVERPIALDEPDADAALRRGTLVVPADAPPSLALRFHRIHWAVQADLGARLAGKVRFPVAIAPAAAPEPEPESTSADAVRPQRIDEGPFSVWIDAAPPSFEAGATLSGHYAVHPDADHRLRTVECSVLWTTEGPGSNELDVIHYEEDVADDGDDLPLYGERSFRCRLPDGPPSHDGPLFRIRWVVRLRLRYADGGERVIELPFRRRSRKVASSSG
jgi:hypothetical protein